MSTTNARFADASHWGISQIDDEVALLRARISHLLALRNTRVPVSQLPQGLLLDIMTMYKHEVECTHQRKFEDDKQSLDSGSFLYPSYRWIKISQVCHAWREAALGSAGLWSSIYIPFAKPEWITELLRRSQSAPISMALSSPPSDPDTSIPDYLLQFLGKSGLARPLRRLHLLLDKNSPMCNSSKFSSLRLDDLEALALVSPPDLFNHLRTELATRSYATFFAGRRRQLRSLTLGYYAWDKRLLHESLTSLTLYGISGFGVSAKLTWDQFLSILVSLKQLCHLQLKGFLNYIDQEDMDDSASISLPKLRSLNLSSDDFIRHAQFLKMVSVPSQASIRIHSIGPMRDLTKTFASFSRILPRVPRSQPYHFLEIQVDKSHIIGEMAISITVDHALPPYSHDSFHRTIAWTVHSGDISMTIWPEPAYSAIIALTPLLPFDNLRILSLRSQFSDYLGSSLLEALATAPAIDTIHIYEDATDPKVTPGLLQSLPPCSKHCTKNLPHISQLSGWPSLCKNCKTNLRTHFPALRTIKHFNEGPNNKDDPDYRLRHSLRHLHAYLSILQDSGRKIKTLELTGYKNIDGTPGWISGLRRLCDNIVVVDCP